MTLYVRECFDCLECNDSENRLENLWVRIRGNARRQVSQRESVIDPEIRMKRQIKYSLSSWEESHKCLPLLSLQTST